MMKKYMASVFGVATIGLSLAACSGGDENASCSTFPVGIYNVVTGHYTGDTGWCVDAANALNAASGSAATVTITKVSDTSYQIDDGDGSPVAYTLDTSACTLSGTAEADKSAKDQAGKTVDRKAVRTTKVSASGDDLTVDATFQYSSDTPGQLGYPCTLTAHLTGTKKK